MRTAPTWRPPSSIRSSANTRGRGAAARRSRPSSSTTCRVSCGPAASPRRRATAAPTLIRVVVAIDPAATSTTDADETGIIVAGKDNQGRAWVLADASGRYRPTEWAKTAIAAYRAHRADRIVAEVNHGGEMIEA